MRSIRSRRARSRQVALPEMNMTPLIDIAWCLLIVFMVTTPLIENSLDVSLPETKSLGKEATQQEKQDLVVSLDKDQRLYINALHVPIDVFEKRMKEALQGKENQTVFFKADQASNYGDVIKYVDVIRGIRGVKFVALSTKKSTGTPA